MEENDDKRVFGRKEPGFLRPGWNALGGRGDDEYRLREEKRSNDLRRIQEAADEFVRGQQGKERCTDVEAVKAWVQEYAYYLWEIEQTLLRSEGWDDLAGLASLDEYLKRLYRQYSESRSYDQDQNAWNRKMEYPEWRNSTLIVMSDHVVEQWGNLFRDNKQLRSKYGFDERRALTPVELRMLLPELSDYQRRVFEKEGKKPLQSYWSRSELYGFSKGAGDAVIEWCFPRSVESNNADDVLVHAFGVGAATGIAGSGMLGRFTDGRKVSWSLGRVGMDRRYIAVAHVQTLKRAGFPMMRVDEARDAFALQEVASWPIPIGFCRLIETKEIPDKKPTNNNPNSDQGTYYGVEFLKDLGERMTKGEFG